jgi:hypothetical protein
MEELIRQAFLHVEGLGPHVAEGHYDLIGPNGEIILPRVWETTIEPDWAISMHMWPIPEPSKPPLPGRGVPSLAPGHHFRANHGRPPSRHVPPMPPPSQMRGPPPPPPPAWMSGPSRTRSRSSSPSTDFKPSKIQGWLKKANKLFSHKDKDGEI